MLKKINIKIPAKQTDTVPVQRDFFKDVYEVVKQIPKGRVTNYGAIAKYLGTALSARMVGWAMNAAHVDPTIPAHRVVNRNGMLSGKMHFGAPDEMEKKLQNEGIKIENDQVVDFKNVLWDPTFELTL